jgi:hypothetical protein
MCIVGNGPSACGKGDEIDACDFVVRMSGWWRSGPGDSGRRLDAYAWFGAQEQCEVPEEYAFSAFEHWMTLPVQRCWPHTTPTGVQHGGQWSNVAEKATLRPIRWVTQAMWNHELAMLTLLSKTKTPEAPPSTGFTAVDMAIHLYQPTEILLYGFDATTKDRDGWSDNNPQWTDNGPHDLHLEKQLIHKLAAEGVWINGPCGVKVTWPDDPIAREEST